MSDPADPADPVDPVRRQSDWRRRRRLAEVFGDVLSDTTRDERDPAERAGRDGGPGDRWLREQVPPHHG